MAFLNLHVSMIVATPLILASLTPATFAQDTSSALVEPATLQDGAVAQYEPLTLSRRYQWAARTIVSPSRLAGYAVSSGLSTMGNHPEEYGPHWDGYAKRVGMRLSSGATGTMMEASLGALWNEDPRYVRATGQPLKNRLANIAKSTFLARNRNGQAIPAYARYISVPANSYLTNAWRADSETDARHTVIRIPMSFLSRAIGNTFTEFWPDATRWMHRN